MLKEVGASGQISLGKRFAKRRFEAVFHADGRIEHLPVQVVPMVRRTPAFAQPSPDGWLPPGGYEQSSQWAMDNREALDAYAAHIAHEGTAAEQLQAYLAAEAAPEAPRD